VDEFVLPHVSRTVFGGAPAYPGKFVISRSAHLPLERHRTRAMLWHWDSYHVQPMVKVPDTFDSHLLYSHRTPL